MQKNSLGVYNQSDRCIEGIKILKINVDSSRGLYKIGLARFLN